MNYLHDGAVMVQIWGKYKPPKGKKNVNTKDALHGMMMKGSVAAGGGTQVKVGLTYSVFIVKILIVIFTYDGARTDSNFIVSVLFLP